MSEQQKRKPLLGRLFRMLLRRALWKWGIEHHKWAMYRLERDLAEARNEAQVNRECYTSNLEELRSKEWLIKRLRIQLSQLGQQLPKNKPKLP